MGIKVKRVPFKVLYLAVLTSFASYYVRGIDARSMSMQSISNHVQPLKQRQHKKTFISRGSKAFASQYESPVPPLLNKGKLEDVIASRGGSAKTDVVERTLATVAMLALLTLLVKKFGENGIIALVLTAQFLMYQEVCTVIESYHTQAYVNATTWTMDVEHQWQKWLWFVTAQMATTFSAMMHTGAFPVKIAQSMFDLIAFAFGGASLMLTVIGMSIHTTTGPQAYRAYLGEVATSLFALMFLVGLSSFMILTLKDFGIEWIIFSVFLVVTNDIMAYVFGRLVGNNKLLPRLSPKKTVEGFVGAAVSTMAISIPLLRFILKHGAEYADVFAEPSMIKHAVALAAYASIVAPFGGFLASAVKRAHHAKDFGDLIPGHGGVVDRVDCQVVMAPFVFLYLKNFLN